MSPSMIFQFNYCNWKTPTFVIDLMIQTQLVHLDISRVLQNFVVIEKNYVSHVNIFIFNMYVIPFLFMSFLNLLKKSYDKVVFLQIHYLWRNFLYYG